MQSSDFVSRLERMDAHFIIGVAGDSGSGKSTLTKGIREMLGDSLVSAMSMDDYHMEDRETRKRTGRLPLDPAVNKLDLLAKHLAELKAGREVIKPNYDHKAGTFAPDSVFEPSRVLMVEGLHAFYTEALRKSIDFGIFVDPEREVKWAWKEKRDIEVRGHDRLSVEEEMRRREPLFKLYIDHQKIHAEVVIKVRRSRLAHGSVQVEMIQEIPKVPMAAIDLDFDLSGLMRASERDFSMEFRSDFYYGKPVTRMTFDGLLHREAVSGLERKIQDFTGLSDRTVLPREMEYVDAVSLSQLLVCWRFLERADFVLRDVEGALK